MDSSLSLENQVGIVSETVKRPARVVVARALGTFIFYAMLTILALLAVPYGSVEPWWRALFGCAVLGLGILGAIEILIGSDISLRKYGLLLPFLALITFALIQSLALWPSAGSGRHALSADPYNTRGLFYHLCTIAIAAALLIRYMQTEERLLRLVYVIVAIGGFSALFGILRAWTQQTQGFFLPMLMPGEGYGQFINHNHFAFLMEMSLGLVIGILAGGGAGRVRSIGLAVFALVMWAALILCMSRGGLLALLGLLLFVVLLFNKARRNRTEKAIANASQWGLLKPVMVKAVLIVGLLIGVVYSIVWIGGEPVLSRLERASSDFSQDGAHYRANTSRKDIWRATLMMFEDNPIAGVGFGGYWALIPKYHEASGSVTPQEAHNDYLELLASGGLIGAAILLWFVITLILKARRRLRSPDATQRAICLGALAGIFAVAIHSIMDFGLHIPVNTYIFAALAVMATTPVLSDKEAKSP